MKKIISSVVGILLVVSVISVGGVGASAKSEKIILTDDNYVEYFNNAYYTQYPLYYLEKSVGYSDDDSYWLIETDNGPAAVFNYGFDSDVVPQTVNGYPVIAVNCIMPDHSETLNPVIPEGVIAILPNCFYEKYGLYSVSLPSTLKYIGAGAFDDCSLTEAVIPEGVTYIGTGAFNGNAFGNLYLPSTIETLSGDIFMWYEIYDIMHVYYAGTEEKWNKLVADSGGLYYNNDMVVTYFTGNQSFEAESIKPAEGGN
ncbi:MAG: leucine-rich repeat domain-containing protein, partial [Acutalibacteraceae bacterium]